MYTISGNEADKILPQLRQQFDIRKLRINKNLIPLSVSINLRNSQ